MSQLIFNIVILVIFIMGFIVRFFEYKDLDLWHAIIYIAIIISDLILTYKIIF